MISPDRLERYSDFVDPERTGDPYDSRQGLERLMGILSPDPKGLVLAAMGEDWYRNSWQLRNRVFLWLEELGLPSKVWPLTDRPTWQYIESEYKQQIIDGSLVNLGAVVKRVELDPFQRLYRRSIVGAELAVPMVQQAVTFVSRAREYAESQKLQGKKPPKFDSMWRIIGGVHSSTNQRKSLAVFDTIDFLIHNPGIYRETDLHNETHVSYLRLKSILHSLGNSGIIDYSAPTTEKKGQRGRGWSVYTIVSPQSVLDLNPTVIYQDIRSIDRHFSHRTHLKEIIDYIKEHPDDEYENNALAKRLDIRLNYVSAILSSLAGLNILKRPNPGFKGGETQSSVSANDLTYLLYDLVCAPAKEVADTLTPLPLRPWGREELAIYLQNYNEERSHTGIQGGEDARSLLIEILSGAQGEMMKRSYLVDLYNGKAETELRAVSLGYHLSMLLRLGLVEQPRPGYYRLVQS